MINDYKRAMDKIKTDADYKAKFIENIQEKSTQKKPVRFLPVVSYLSTAAAVLLVVYCTVLFFAKQPEDIQTRMRSETSYSYNEATNVIYFIFDGFEKYNITLEEKAVLFGEFDKDYTVANFLSDYYPVIAGEDGEVEISDGMVDNFHNVTTDENKEINIYINDRELLNLEQELVSEYLEQEDVYFKVSVEE